MLKLNYFVQRNWAFLFQNTKIGYFEKKIYDIIFKLEDYLEPATSEWIISHWNSKEILMKKWWNVPNRLYPSLPFTTTQ